MNTYPILEYDGSPEAVLEPNHRDLGIELPERVAFPILGDYVSEYARQRGLPVLGTFETVTKNFTVYRVSDRVALCEAPIGAPGAASLLDWLIAYGAKQIVAAGSCGELVDLPANAFVLPRRALRDEGTSYHYMPPSRWSYLDSQLQQRIAETLDEEGIDYVKCDTWTTDAIYRETVDKVRRCRAEGCSVVEMECAALSAVAEFRNVQFGQFMFVADSLADADAFDARDWGAKSTELALRLCLKALEYGD